MTIGRVTKKLFPNLYRSCIDYARTHRLYRKKRKDGRYRYTVIAAVYNVDKYLDDFFRSLTGQILDFKTHIQLFMVDDGSTDSSATIIKQWQQRFPENIVYIYKENGGQGSARNMAIPLIKTPWVTFIDPDDFVDVTYFLHVDNLLREHHGEHNPDQVIQLLSCNLIFYREHNGAYVDKHRLRRRFTAIQTIIPHTDMDNIIQLTTNTVFFLTKTLHFQKLLFDERRWPTFEDGHFVLRYLQKITNGNIIFARWPRYYYRKRVAKNSSIDTSRADKALYLNQVREAYLGILADSYRQHSGAIPIFVQRTILYDLCFSVKELLDAPHPQCLCPAEREEHFSLLCQCFSYIDAQVIEAYDTSLNGIDAFCVVGILACFKNMKPSTYTMHADLHDSAKNQITLTYACGELPCEEILIGGEKQTPLKTISTYHTFAGKPFCICRTILLQIPEQSTSLIVMLDGVCTTIYSNQLTLNPIL